MTPSGIHNTPSKRAKRSKALAVKVKSSPLKPPPVEPPAPASGQSTVPKLDPHSARQRSALHPSAVRGVRPFDPEEDKRRRRDGLLAEVAQLEYELALAAAENNRIHQSKVGGVRVSAPPNRDEILGVLRKNAVSQDDEAPDATTSWLKSATNPSTLLPFGKAGLSLSSLFGQQNAPQKEDPLISHQPLEMTAKEELPYLQTFASLDLSSSITMLPRDSEDEPLLQRHSITAASTHLPGVFSAQIDMTVDTETLVIVELAVPRLDPASYAELNPMIERILGSAEPSSALTRNVNVLGWAMGEWLRVALSRARFWVLLDKQLGTSRALAESVVHVRSHRVRKRRQQGAGRDDMDDDRASRPVGKSASVSRAELLPHMGRTSMDFDIPTPSDQVGSKTTLRVLWRIEFDWAGEARSRLGALVGVPGKCELSFRLGREPLLTLLARAQRRRGRQPRWAVGVV